jgi:hypothetical protein
MSMSDLHIEMQQLHHDSNMDMYEFYHYHEQLQEEKEKDIVEKCNREIEEYLLTREVL